MWSLTSPRADRISGPEKFCSSARKDFFNSIGQQATSFDHLVGAGDEGSRKIEAEGFCRLQVNHQIIFGRSLDRKIGRLLALENAIDITGRAPKLVDAIGPVENQPAAVDIVSVAIHGRKSVLGSQFNDEIAMRRHSGARRYDQASIP